MNPTDAPLPSRPLRPRRRAPAARALACALAAVAPALAAGDAAPALRAVGDDDAPLRQAWTSPLGTVRAHTIFLGPTGLGSVRKVAARDPGDAVWPYLFVLTEDNRLGCLNADDGGLRWWVPMNAAMVGRPAFSQNGVYFIAGQQLFGVEPHTGRLEFKLPLDFAPAAGPGVLVDGGGFDEKDVADDIEYWKDSFLVAGLDERMRRLDVARVPWPPRLAAELGAAGDNRTFERRLATRWVMRMPHGQGNPFGSVLTASDHATFMLAFNNNLPGRGAGYLCAWDMEPEVREDASTTRLPESMATVRAQRPFSAPPALHDGLVFTPSFDGSLYATTAAGNDVGWRFMSGGDLELAPQRLGDAVGANPALILLRVGGRQAARGRLVALELAANRPDGATYWTHPDGWLGVARMAQRKGSPNDHTFVVVQNVDGTLSAVQMSNGHELWRVRHAADAVYCPNTREPFVYALADGGRAVAALELMP